MKKLILFLALTFLSINLNAQTWQKGGSIGTYIECMAFESQTAIVGTDTLGVFKSIDYGRTWNQVNTGLNIEHPGFLSVLINSHYFFAGNYGGLFYSSDMGNSWFKVEGLISGPSAASLIQKYKNKVIYEKYRELFLSEDYGLTWNLIKQSYTLQTEIVKSISLANDTLYEITQEGDVLSSLDSGNSWTKLNDGIDHVNCYLFVDRSLYIGTKSNGVFLSSNNGYSWTEMNNGVSNQNIISITALGSHNLLAVCNGSGLILSTNAGSSWTSFNQGILDSANIQEVQSSGNNAMARTTLGDFYYINLDYLGLNDKESRSIQEPLISPNPSADHFNLSLGMTQAGDYTIEIVDILGEPVVGSIRDYSADGAINKQIDVSHVPTGEYFIRISAAGAVRVGKLMVVR